MYDVGDGYSLSSPVTRNKFREGSNTRFIVSSRNSVTKKTILDPHYKRHSYALSKNLPITTFIITKLRAILIISSPFTNCVKGLNPLVDKFLGLLACEIILRSFPKILYHTNSQIYGIP